MYTPCLCTPSATNHFSLVTFSTNDIASILLFASNTIMASHAPSISHRMNASCEAIGREPLARIVEVWHAANPVFGGEPRLEPLEVFNGHP